MRSTVKLFSSLLFVTICICAGCGGPASTGHTDDPTPSGTATPDTSELMDDAAFDDYAKQQGGG